MSQKGVIFLKILIYEFSGFFWIFLEFILIFTDLILSKNGKKGVIFPQEPCVDVVRSGTRTDATWHARPRGRATRAHAGAWVALM